MHSILQPLKTIILALFFAFSVSYVFAAWSGPTATPPDGNTDAPVNVGIVDQIKDAGLGVNALSVFGNGLFVGYVVIGDTTTTCDTGIEGAFRYNETSQVPEYCDGTNWQAFGSGRGGSGGLLGAPIVFDSPGDFTYTKNELASRIMIICTAGGGGGGADGNRSGSAGGTSIKVLENDLVDPTVTVTIGAGGAGGIYNQQPSVDRPRSAGYDGESSSFGPFGSFCSATGGIGGSNYYSDPGGVGSGGDINLTGDGSGQAMGSDGNPSDSGGSSYWSGGGSGGGGQNRTEVGSAGTHGSGGGAGSGGSYIANGGAGGDGIIVIWEYK